MERIEKTVFISYRRINFPWALAVWQNLKQYGYDVFIDYDGLKSGDYESALLENIPARAHFLVILTPSALERCVEPKDMMRREIETALSTRRNVVSLMLEGFSFGTPAIANQLTGTLEPIKRYQGLSIPNDYFLEAMERLRSRYLNVALTEVTHPPSASAQLAASEQNAAAAAAPAVQEQELTAQQYFERALASSDPGEKIRLNTEAIRLNIEFAEAYYNRGLARYSKGYIDGAIEDFSEAIRLRPDLEEAFNNRGIARQAKGDLDGALEDFNQAARLKPGDADAFNNRGIVRKAKGDLDGALEDYNQAIRLNPSDAGVFYNRGIARKAKGDLDGALEDYNAAIQLNPDYASAFGNRGGLRQAKGDLDGAIEDYSQAIRLKPDFINAYYNRGMLFRKQSQQAAAIVDLQQYLKLGGGMRDGDTEKVE